MTKPGTFPQPGSTPKLTALPSRLRLCHVLHPGSPVQPGQGRHCQSQGRRESIGPTPSRKAEEDDWQMRVGSPSADERTLLCWVRGAQPWGWHTAAPGVDFWPAVGLLLPPFLPQEVPGPYGPQVGAALPPHGHGAGGAPPGRVLPHLCQMGQGGGKCLESLCQPRGNSRTPARPRSPCTALLPQQPQASSFPGSPCHLCRSQWHPAPF